MKVTIERDELRRALAAVKPATGGFSYHGFVGCVRLDAGKKTVTVAADNLDVRAETDLACDVGEPGAVFVPHATLSKLAARLGEGAVELHEVDGKLHVNAAGVTADLPTVPVDEWPKRRDPADDGTEVTFTADQWGRLQAVTPAASSDNNRPLLCGVGFSDGQAAATDSYCMLWCDVPLHVTAVIPAATVRSVDADGEPVVVACDGRRVRIASAGVTVSGACIEGDFPNWRRLIPDRTPTTVTVDRDPLVDAVKTAAMAGAAVSERNGRIVRLHLAAGEIVGRSSELGEVAVQVGWERDGDADLVGVNSAVLLAVLDGVDGDRLRVGVTDQLKPVTVSGGGAVEGMLMPTRLPQ